MKNLMKWAKPVIQAIISALLLGLLITCGLLPAKYLGIAAVVVLLLLLITVLTSRSDNTAARSLGTILAIAVSLVLAFGAVYLHQVMRTLDRVSGSNTEINNIVVIVAHENSAQKIEETSGYTFGVYEGLDTSYIDQMKE